MTAVYKFKSGSHLSGDAQAIGQRLEQIRAQRDGITPEAVVADAKIADSPLHPMFEWDDAKAATSYRISQAGHIIRCVTVQIEPAAGDHTSAEPPTVVRAFLPVHRSDGAQVYESTARVMSDAEFRRQVLLTAHAELAAVARKHRELKELADVVASIDRVGELLKADGLPA